MDILLISYTLNNYNQAKIKDLFPLWPKYCPKRSDVYGRAFSRDQPVFREACLVFLQWTTCLIFVWEKCFFFIFWGVRVRYEELLSFGDLTCNELIGDTSSRSRRLYTLLFSPDKFVLSYIWFYKYKFIRWE